MRFRWLVTLALFLASLGAAPLAAQEPAPAQAFFRAADRLEQRLLAADAAGPLPGMADPEVAALIRALSDPAPLANVAGAEGYDLLGRIADRAMALGVRYGERGVTGPQNSPARIEAQNRNLVLYQAEVFPLWTVMMHAVGRMVELNTDAVRGLSGAEIDDGQRNGAVQVRRGLQMVLTGVVGLLRLDGITAERRELMLDAVARKAHVLAGIYPVAERRQALQLFQTLRSLPLNTGARAALARIEQAFSSDSCEGFCRL